MQISEKLQSVCRDHKKPFTKYTKSAGLRSPSALILKRVAGTECEAAPRNSSDQSKLMRFPPRDWVYSSLTGTIRFRLRTDGAYWDSGALTGICTYRITLIKTFPRKIRCTGSSDSFPQPLPLMVQHNQCMLNISPLSFYHSVRPFEFIF